MPSDRTLHLMNTLHRAVLRLSGGRIGWRAARMPMLELTTTGRKSGLKRSIMLSSPMQLDDAIVVVASRGGDDHHPSWYLNVEAEPRVDVVYEGRPSTPMRARVATGAERAELWPAITNDHRNYAAYQRRTDREIPVVLLEPVDGEADRRPGRR